MILLRVQFIAGRILVVGHLERADACYALEAYNEVLQDNIDELQ
jgi:hypothetical protein